MEVFARAEERWKVGKLPGKRQGRIWLIGGTVESGEIAREIAAKGWPCTISVTTTEAIALYKLTPNLKVKVGSIEANLMADFLKAERIIAIVDATHPHAAQISKFAIAQATLLSIPYLRFERPQIKKEGNAIELDSFPTLLAGNYLQGQRVLLTIGCNNLPRFSPWQQRATLFARVLPNLRSIEIARASGFSSDRIVALRPPYSIELEKAIWQHWQVSAIVTKANGKAGGEDIKRRLAAELGKKLIIIARPDLNYPQQTSNSREVLAFCAEQITGKNLYK